MAEKDKICDTVTGIQNGTLAAQITKNAKFVMTGAVIGGIAGFLLATVMGRCKLCIGFWCALAGSSVGYLYAQNECGCKKQ